MKHIILIMLTLVVSTSYAQEKYNTTISYYNNVNTPSDGFEVRKSFNKSYLTLQLERFIENDINYNEVTLGTGLFTRVSKVTFTSGIRAGLMEWKTSTSFLTGADLGIEVNVSHDLIVGVKYILNNYTTNIKSNLPTNNSLYFRIGYQFNTSNDSPDSGGKLLR